MKNQEQVSSTTQLQQETVKSATLLSERPRSANTNASTHKNSRNAFGQRTFSQPVANMNLLNQNVVGIDGMKENKPFHISRPSTATPHTPCSTVSIKQRLRSANPAMRRNTLQPTQTEANLTQTIGKYLDNLFVLFVEETLSVKSMNLKQRAQSINFYSQEGKDFHEKYNCPKTNKHNYRILHGTVSRQRGNYMTITTITNKASDLVKVFENRRPSTPSSVLYSKVRDWSKNIKDATMPKQKKISFIGEIFKREAMSKSPGPSTYKPIIKDLKNKVFQIGKDQQLLMFNEIKIRSNEMPSCFTYKINHNSIEAKSRAAIICNKKKEDYKPLKIRVHTGPGVGQYKNSDKPHINANDKKNPVCCFGKTKRITSIAEIIEKKKVIPSVGKYNHAEQYDNTVRATSLVRGRIG